MHLSLRVLCLLEISCHHEQASPVYAININSNLTVCLLTGEVNLFIFSICVFQDGAPSRGHHQGLLGASGHFLITGGGTGWDQCSSSPGKPAARGYNPTHSTGCCEHVPRSGSVPGWLSGHFNELWGIYGAGPWYQIPLKVRTRKTSAAHELLPFHPPDNENYTAGRSPQFPRQEELRAQLR